MMKGVEPTKIMVAGRKKGNVEISPNKSNLWYIHSKSKALTPFARSPANVGVSPITQEV